MSRPLDERGGEAALRHWSCPTCQAPFRTDFHRCPVDGSALRPAHEDPLLGRVFAERYRLEGVIGEGATGRVYRAKHVETGRALAVKVLFGEIAASERWRKRLRREATSVSRLDHPAIVQVVDLVEQGALLLLVLGLASGENLGARIDAGGPVPVNTALRWGREIAAALAHAHARGVIHRDLKPENILVDPSDRICIVDFGLALAVAGDAPAERLTEHGTVVGTPGFVAPEQFMGGPVDERADLYALGALLFFLLAGRGPFVGSVYAVLQQAVSTPAPRLETEVRGPVPAGLTDLVAALLERQPEDRPRSAEAVAEALDRILEDERSVPVPSRASRPGALDRILEDERSVPVPSRASRPGALHRARGDEGRAQAAPPPVAPQRISGVEPRPSAAASEEIAREPEAPRPGLGGRTPPEDSAQGRGRRGAAVRARASLLPGVGAPVRFVDGRRTWLIVLALGLAAMTAAVELSTQDTARRGHVAPSEGLAPFSDDRAPSPRGATGLLAGPRPPVEMAPPFEMAPRPPFEMAPRPPFEMAPRPPVEMAPRPPVETGPRPPVERALRPPVETGAAPAPELSEEALSSGSLAPAPTLGFREEPRPPARSPPSTAGESASRGSARSRSTPQLGPEDLVERYRAVGVLLEDLRARSPARAFSLGARYRALPLQRALRDPAVRRRMANALDALERNARAKNLEP